MIGRRERWQTKASFRRRSKRGNLVAKNKETGSLNRKSRKKVLTECHLLKVILAKAPKFSSRYEFQINLLVRSNHLLLRLSFKVSAEN